MPHLTNVMLMCLAALTIAMPAKMLAHDSTKAVNAEKALDAKNDQVGGLDAKNKTVAADSAKEAADAADHEVAKFTSGTLASCAEVKMEGFCSHEKAKTHCPVSCKTAKADTHIVQSTGKDNDTTCTACTDDDSCNYNSPTYCGSDNSCSAPDGCCGGQCICSDGCCSNTCSFGNSDATDFCFCLGVCGVNLVCTGSG